MLKSLFSSLRRIDSASTILYRKSISPEVLFSMPKSEMSISAEVLFSYIF